MEIKKAGSQPSARGRQTGSPEQYALTRSLLRPIPRLWRVRA
jgi:hypothetical protein